MDTEMNNVPGATLRRKLRFSYGLMTLLACMSADAHLFLTPDSLADAMATIERLSAKIEELPDNSDVRAEAWFELGTAAQHLARLLNEEVAAHGDEQRDLMVSAVTEAAGNAVAIDWSAEHERFFYDGLAFDRYLALEPDGAHAGFSRFQRIERQFYLSSPDDRAALEERAADKRDFLERFPQAGTGPRVAMFLGIDYRDLWRLCRREQDTVCAARYLDLAHQQFADIARDHADGDIGAVAQRMLERLAAETSPAAN
jgi:hypothetical protein